MLPVGIAFVTVDSSSTSSVLHSMFISLLTLDANSTSCEPSNPTVSRVTLYPWMCAKTIHHQQAVFCIMFISLLTLCKFQSESRVTLYPASLHIVANRELSTPPENATAIRSSLEIQTSFMDSSIFVCNVSV